MGIFSKLKKIGAGVKKGAKSFAKEHIDNAKKQGKSFKNTGKALKDTADKAVDTVKNLKK